MFISIGFQYYLMVDPSRWTKSFPSDRFTAPEPDPVAWATVTHPAFVGHMAFSTVPPLARASRRAP